MKPAFIALCMFVTTVANAQLHYYELKPGIPDAYAYNADSVYRMLAAKNNGDLSEEWNDYYAETQAYYHERILRSGLIYFEWKECEDYLTDLVNRLAKAIGDPRPFKVFVLREGEANASAQDNGIIYVNVGMLAAVQNEAALAGILGHELSHVVNSDTKKNFRYYSKLTRKLRVEEMLQTSHQNRAYEERADKQGFIAAADLDYDISSCYHSFIKFESEYRWRKNQYKYQNSTWHITVNGQRSMSMDSLEYYLMDHPESGLRLSALQEYMGYRNGARRFSDNEAFFYDMQYKARLEQLFIELSNGEHLSCLINAFYYHLLDQQDRNYLYYVTEALRRLIFIEPGLKNKGFLTDDNKAAVFEDNKGILHDLSFLSMDTTFLLRMRADTFYSAGNKPFETYLQAYRHFYKTSSKAGVEASALNVALFELSRNKKEKVAEHLKKYLEEDSARHRGFAESVLKGNTLSDLDGNRNNLVYVDAPEYYYNVNGVDRYSHAKSKALAEKAMPYIKARFRPEPDFNTTFLIADLLNIRDYHTYSVLHKNLMVFKSKKELQFYNRPFHGYSPQDYWKTREGADPLDPEVLKHNNNFFYLEPSYWSLFKQEKIHAFTYFKPYFYLDKDLGTMFFFEITYFDPANKVYFYFDQQYARRYNKHQVKAVCRRFSKELGDLITQKPRRRSLISHILMVLTIKEE